MSDIKVDCFNDERVPLRSATKLYNQRECIQGEGITVTY